MASLLAKKLATFVAVMFLVTAFSFILISLLPTKPENLLVPVQTSGANADTIAAYKQQIRHDLHLDQPLYKRYGRWISDIAHGNLGYYYRGINNKEPVSKSFKKAFPVSLELLIYSQLLALLFAIPLGIYTAQRAGKRSDRITNGVLFAFLAVPNFVLGLLLAYFVGVKLGWVPPSGYTYLSANLVDHAKSMILPSIALAAGQIAIYQRLLRTDMIQTLQEDFVLVAKAKGMSNRRVLWRHALRPSSFTLLTVAGLNFGTLIGGAVVIEVIFGLPGIGSLLSQAILARQYIALQSLIAIVAAIYVIVIFAVDLLYAVLDPRIRHVRSAS